MKNKNYIFFLINALLLSCNARVELSMCEPSARYKHLSVATIYKEALVTVQNPNERKAISYSLYGKRPKEGETPQDRKKYVLGLLENIMMAKELRPTWEVVVFADPLSVSEDILKQAEELGARVLKDPSYNHPSARFFIADMEEYDRFISRDADSRLSIPELAAVAEWMENPWAILHSMHDSSNQRQMLAGMWGGRTKLLQEKLKAKGYKSMKDAYEKYVANLGRSVQYGDDEFFLQEIVVPTVGYDSFLTHEKQKCQAFPKSRGYPIPLSVGRNISSGFLFEGD